MHKKLNIVISANTMWFLDHFESSLIEQLRDEGHTVHRVAPGDEHDITINRSGINPLQDIKTCIAYYRTFRTLKPDVLLNFTIKPVIYGSIAARFLRIPTINTITGMGTVFIKGGIVRWIVMLLYRIALPKTKVFVLNNTDLSYFKARGYNTRQVFGAGVDLERFAYAPPIPKDVPIFLYFGRILKDKGIYELVEAARKTGARVQILGNIDEDNRSAIQKDEIDLWLSEHTIEYLGATDDVRKYIQNANCVVLPSYREGMPTMLLEAAAIGRPIITTDVPGCRDVVEDGVNGLLVPARDIEALAHAMQKMIEIGHAQRVAMGRASRMLAEKKYDEQSVIRAYIAQIEGLL